MRMHETESLSLSTRNILHAAAAVIVTVFSLGASSARADAVLHWNEIMERTVENADPFQRLRTAAITQVAVFEAVNSIDCEYVPYREAVPAAPGASSAAAAIAAAHRTLSTLHPESAATLDSLRDASLARIPEGDARDEGVRVGVEAADAILALRTNDGTDTVVPYTPSMEPGEWQPTPPDFAVAYMPGLGKIKPFGIEHGAQFRVRPPPPLHSERYARDYEEVKTMGDVNSSRRTKEQSDIARFYEVTEPVPIYNPAARQVIAARDDRSISENARLFALLNMAVHDAAVVVFDAKYLYNLWRPITAIPAGNMDGNRKTKPVANWQSYVYTPPFPSYPSGHAGFGGAARKVLEHLLGRRGHSITLTNAAAPEIVLHYSSWKEITDDVDDGRVYGGVHYRFDQEAGARQGRRVGGYILRHQLLPAGPAQGSCRKGKRLGHPSK